MAYADQEMSGNRIAAFVIVALLHIALVYALVTGLAYQGFQAVVKKVTTVDIKKDEPKKEEKPPPPKKDVTPPPIVVPPPRINLTPPQNNVETVTSAEPVRSTQTNTVNTNTGYTQTPTPTPTPRAPTVAGKPKGNPGGWVTNDDYPTRAMREERQGTTGFRLTYDANGRPTSCDITSSSGSPDLDSTACSLLMRRAKFTPGMEDGKPVGGSWSSRFRWVIPDE
jgi:periplasmic protein TonB